MNPLKIGNVIRVENGRVEIVVTVTDLNMVHEGRTYRVGQLGSYVTIPMDDRTVVGFVVATGRQDATVVDIEPQLLVKVQLVGEIKAGGFCRGVNEYPIVGDDVWMADRETFESIFGSFDQLLSGTKHPQSFCLGRFGHNTEFEVKVLGSPFFAKHVAILGNSGSGKSCTTARILQEVLDLNQGKPLLIW